MAITSDNVSKQTLACSASGVGVGGRGVASGPRSRRVSLAVYRDSRPNPACACESAGNTCARGRRRAPAQPTFRRGCVRGASGAVCPRETHSRGARSDPLRTGAGTLGHLIPDAERVGLPLGWPAPAGTGEGRPVGIAPTHGALEGNGFSIRRLTQMNTDGVDDKEQGCCTRGRLRIRFGSCGRW
jgi:hypothetical protein